MDKELLLGKTEEYIRPIVAGYVPCMRTVIISGSHEYPYDCSMICKNEKLQ